jgi:hypothetical protein
MRSYQVFLIFVLLISNSYQWYNGLNMPWNNCGNDFGNNINEAVYKAAFQKYHNSGANSVRVWIFYDGAKSMSLYDTNGHFKTLSSNFYKDLGVVL